MELRHSVAMLLLLLLIPVAGCERAGAKQPETTFASEREQQPKGAADSTITATDRQLILLAAKSEMADVRAGGFAAVSEKPVSKREVGRAALGGVEPDYHIKPARLARAQSLFEATSPYDPPSASVPIILGDRQLGRFYFEKVDGKWKAGSTMCEAPHWDSARVQLEGAYPEALGGQPSEVRWVNVDGSIWLIARRGDREAAGLVALYAYGCSGDLSVQLPAPGTLLTPDEFRALLGQMESPH